MSTFVTYSDELYHYGIKGQKRGVRRYQNPDGSLTAEGRARYGRGGGSGAASGGRGSKGKMSRKKKAAIAAGVGAAALVGGAAAYGIYRSRKKKPEPEPEYTNAGVRMRRPNYGGYEGRASDTRQIAKAVDAMPMHTRKHVAAKYGTGQPGKLSNRTKKQLKGRYMYK